MPYFYWQGINTYGETKKGTNNAQSPHHLKEVLLSQGIALLTHSQTRPLYTKFLHHFYISTIPQSSICDFLERLALLISNGVDLITALKTVQPVTTNKSLRHIIHQLVESIQQGQSLHDALEHYPQLFPPFIVQLIAAGERTGKLGISLENLTNHLLEQQRIKRQFTQAMLAPLLTLGTALALLIIIIIFIFPYFESLYHSLGSSIPTSTKFILALSHTLRSWTGLVWLVGIGIGTGIITMLFKTQRIKQFFARIVLYIPIIGPVIIQRNALLFIQTLSLFLSSGLSLTTALEHAQNTVSNFVCKDEIKRIYAAILEGKSLSMAIKSIHSLFFDEQLVALILVGECSGTLEHILVKTERQWSTTLAHKLHTLSTLFTPILMIFVGLIIGGIMIALYMPIFNLSSLIHQ